MTEDMKSTVILCADDFGISLGVNRAIIDLAARGRLSAISCMGVGPAWAEGAAALKAANADVDVGLHLTFTYLPPLTKEWGERFPSLKTIILKSWARLLDKDLVEKEIRAQFEKFIEVWGAPPDFIDGHQHVHILPVIRDVLLRLRVEYAPRSWMRNVVYLSLDKKDAKHVVISVLGWRWRQMLEDRGIKHNKLFRGAYEFSAGTDYASRMKSWCTGSGPTLIYCHPGFPDAGLAKLDPVLEPRRKEYDFFNGSLWSTWLQKQEVVLARHP